MQNQRVGQKPMKLPAVEMPRISSGTFLLVLNGNAGRCFIKRKMKTSNNQFNLTIPVVTVCANRFALLRTNRAKSSPMAQTAITG
jgi:hypothetical protein